jgi:hypothetical protein
VTPTFLTPPTMMEPELITIDSDDDVSNDDDSVIVTSNDSDNKKMSDETDR